MITKKSGSVDYKIIIATLVRYIPIAIICVVLSIFFIRGGLISIKEYLQVASGHGGVTFVIIMFLYLLKSVSFGIPFAFLYVVTGSLYPLYIALCINLCGIFINLQIPYLLGRHAGVSLVRKISRNYPLMARLELLSAQSGLLLAFLCKFIGKIPHEITNTMLGSLQIQYSQYVIGSITGLVPSMLLTTIIGTTASQGSLISMIISILALVLLTIASFIIYKRQVSMHTAQHVEVQDRM